MLVYQSGREFDGPASDGRVCLSAFQFFRCPNLPVSDLSWHFGYLFVLRMFGSGTQGMS